MTILQGILLGGLISGLIICLILGYFESWLIKLKGLFMHFRAKVELNKLEKLGYFELTPIDNVQGAKDIFFNHLKRGRKVSKIWSLFDEELEFDYRSFLIQEDSKNDGIEINWKKWNQVLMTIGLNFNIKENKEVTDEEDKEIQEININNNQYFIIKDYSDENVTKKSFMKFSEIMNKELEKIDSEERTRLYGDYPTRILFLNKGIEKIILGN